jgi:malonyl-CoA O-methyltransferase
VAFNVRLSRWAKCTTKRWLQRLGSPRSRINDLQRSKTMRHLSPPASALAWIRSHETPTGGIRVHSRHANAYAEVTGYLVPTLLQYGERDLATRLIRWLVGMQRADGAYTDPDRGRPYVFDTGQALRALLAGGELVPEARDAARRAADYLCAQLVAGSKGGFGTRYAGAIPESIHLYVLPPLRQAAEVLQKPEYQAAAEHCLQYYCAHEETLQISDLTHFLGYELEALIDLGRADMATPILEGLRGQRAADGSVRGEGGAAWVCSPGLAQLAVCWYKIGQWEPADRALAWLEAHQQPSGGFLGSYGPGAAYFPTVELSWAAKFYLDAHLLRVVSFFERHAPLFPSSVSKDDGRTQVILSVIKPNDRVLEVGCGKGRFLKVVREVYPKVGCTAVDISPALLAYIPTGIQALRGSLESIPCPDNSFDVVFSVEAIEHSANPQAAVAEMIRVTRPGGWVLVIDKQKAHWGRLSCPSWERWPEIAEISRLLKRGCDHVTAEPVGYDDRPQPDGLIVVWRGQKRP